MDATALSQFLSKLEDDGIVDARANPDTNRRGQFLAGWHDHSERGRTYVDRTLQQVTWHNLGWRLAREHHDPAGIDDDEIRDHFDLAEGLWVQRRTHRPQ